MDRHVGTIDHPVAVQVRDATAPRRLGAVGEMDRKIRAVDDAVAVEVAETRIAERDAFRAAREQRAELLGRLCRRRREQSTAGRGISTREGAVEELEPAVGRGAKPRAVLAAPALDPQASAIDLDIDAADARCEADPPQDFAGRGRHADGDEALSATDRGLARIAERIVGELLRDAVEHRGESRRVGRGKIAGPILDVDHAPAAEHDGMASEFIPEQGARDGRTGAACPGMRVRTKPRLQRACATRGLDRQFQPIGEHLEGGGRSARRTAGEGSVHRDRDRRRLAFRASEPIRDRHRDRQRTVHRAKRRRDALLDRLRDRRVGELVPGLPLRIRRVHRARKRQVVRGDRFESRVVADRHPDEIVLRVDPLGRERIAPAKKQRVDRRAARDKLLRQLLDLELRAKRRRLEPGPGVIGDASGHDDPVPDLADEARKKPFGVGHAAACRQRREPRGDIAGSEAVDRHRTSEARRIEAGVAHDPCEHLAACRRLGRCGRRRGREGRKGRHGGEDGRSAHRDRSHVVDS